MQIIARSNLMSVLSGAILDPDLQFTTEFTAFATAILADSPDAQYFVITDHENGDDPKVGYEQSSPVIRSEVIPTTDAPNGYYGMDVSYFEFTPNRKVYGCYLGGCPALSAAGFVITTAQILP